MLIDWFTVAAQLINFLILVGLLTRFLYRPVLRAMDRRETRVTERLREAQKRESEAEDTREHYESKQEELEKKKDSILKETKEKAEKKRKEMLEQAKEEVDRQRSQWQTALEKEQKESMETIRRQSEESILETVRHILKELADAELEAAMAARFITHLQHLPKEKREEFADKATGNQPMVIASNYHLPQDVRQQLTEAMHHYVKDDSPVEFRQKEEVICGIEATAGGARLAWTAESYLESFREELASAIEEAREQHG